MGRRVRAAPARGRPRVCTLGSGARIGPLALVAWLAVLASAITPLAAQDLVAVPELRTRVTDLTGTLVAAQSEALEDKLRDFESQTGSQIAVLLIPTARPEAIEQYAFRVAEEWQLGREGVDDGALLLVALEDREVRIEVGYGFEGVLTDATSNRIIDESILPHFSTGDMYGGLAAGVDRIVMVARGEDLPPPPPSAPVMDGPSLVPLLIVLFMIASVLTAILGRFVGALATGGLAGVVAAVLVGVGFALIAALAGFLMALFVGGAPRRGWSSRTRRGGWGGGFGGGFGGGGGGFGGGGFSGGGGGFGGGGASGSW